MDKCPCGSGKSYAQCCEKYIKGTATAPGPEALMRSRYSAYAKQEIAYIFSTQNPEHQQNLDRKETERWSKESEWLGLEIISAEESGDRGTVEFSARFKQDGKEHDHHEISSFQKIGGKWFFNDGHVPSRTVVREGPKIGRNEPCPCGSGKKYKKCCGLNG